jgi:hypothetical protein
MHKEKNTPYSWFCTFFFFKKTQKTFAFYCIEKIESFTILLYIFLVKVIYITYVATQDQSIPIDLNMQYAHNISSCMKSLL